MSSVSHPPQPALDSLATTCWQRLTAATDDHTDPWRTPAIATRSGNGAAVRTVVLRETQTAQRALSLHTDARSAKAGELAQAPQLSWLFWDAVAREQLRCQGRVTLHLADEVAETHWAQLTAGSRSNYRHHDAPATAISDPQTAAARRDDENTAYGRFLVVRCVVERMDWLHLDREGHRRARLIWTGDHWDAGWVAP
ncbi:MAG: pyridoxamine 5'-phosphate oxidase family protein [Xanthomonadales bacterium]|jgi:pyridoxine/pyridoxamine 5'-phosphate oxidase|nr:pyridoxamine 5'-phosphate oxidase family protein [Xanthomonadales bacterium]